MAWLLHSSGEMALLQGDDAAAQARAEASLALFRDAGHKWGSGFALHNIGYVALHQHDEAHAESAFKECLRLFLELHSDAGVALCLPGLAGVAATRGQAERAARILAAACASREARGDRSWPAHLHEIERNMAAARALLADTAWEAAWNAGRAMTLQQAIAYAVSDEA